MNGAQLIDASVMTVEAHNKYIKSVEDSYLSNPAKLPDTYPFYVAMTQVGEVIRKAKIIDELPGAMRIGALRVAEKKLGISHIAYGTPLWESCGMTIESAKADERQYIMLRGCDLPLSLFWEEMSPTR